MRDTEVQYKLRIVNRRCFGVPFQQQLLVLLYFTKHRLRARASQSSALSPSPSYQPVTPVLHERLWRYVSQIPHC